MKRDRICCIWLTALIMGIALSGCASLPRLSSPETFSSSVCAHRFHNIDRTARDKQLNQIMDLYKNGCYHEVIHLGGFVRAHGRDKLYGVGAEFGEIFTPEGTFTEYVLESYERSFLSLMIAFSYQRLGKLNAAMVELRKTYDEENARLYNHGRDPIVSLLQAAAWDRFDPALSRPYWKFVAEDGTIDKEIRDKAQARISEIDREPLRKVNWKVFGLGAFPELDWESRFVSGKKGTYRIFSKHKFPPACAAESELLISTAGWVDKISIRYNSEYHPWLFAKSLIRVPVGVGYGIAGVSSSIAIGAGGCVAAASVGDKQGHLCGASIWLAGFLIEKSANLVEFTLSPDLRHWSRLPNSFLLARTGESEGFQNSCLRNVNIGAAETVSLLE